MKTPYRPKGTRPPAEGTGTRVRVGEANQKKPLIDRKTHKLRNVYGPTSPTTPYKAIIQPEALQNTGVRRCRRADQSRLEENT